MPDKILVDTSVWIEFFRKEQEGLIFPFTRKNILPKNFLPVLVGYAALGFILGYKIVYYISPQVWAWKENRVKKMKQCIDKMLVILPFEKEYFKLSDRIETIENQLKNGK